MSHARIRKIFSALLNEYATTEGYTVSYDNVKTSFNSAAHLRSHLIPADTFTDTLNGVDHTGYLGIYQITVIAKYGIGTLVHEEIIEELQSIFTVDKVFSDSSGFSVQIITPIKPAEGKQIDGEWVIPCYFNYRSDVN